MSDFKPVKTVIVGCGMIASKGYQPRCQAYPHKLELVGYYDQDVSRAKELAQNGGGKVYQSFDDVLNAPCVEAIINLTIHTGHYPVSLAGLAAGKHVYSEKPVALRIEEADQLVETADAMGVKFACAPVAMLGHVQQNVWQRIREGEIGEVVSAVGNFGGPVEYWHPTADAFMQKGVGPFKDVAPYPLTAMTTMIGRVKRVYGLGSDYPSGKGCYMQVHAQGRTIKLLRKTTALGYLNLKAVLTGCSTTVGLLDRKSHPTKSMAQRGFSRSKHMTMDVEFANAHLWVIGKSRLPQKARTRFRLGQGALRLCGRNSE